VSTARTDDLGLLRQQLTRYLADQRKLREISRPGMSAADAEEANRILTTNYAATLAGCLQTALDVARDLSLDLDASRAEVRGLREQLGVQRRAIEAYQADRVREGRHGGVM
jgi:HJR/Mrr/RecB family endonuclease